MSLCVQHVQSMLNGLRTSRPGIRQPSRFAQEWCRSGVVSGCCLGKRNRAAWVPLAATGLQIFFTDLFWEGRLRTYKYNRKQLSHCHLVEPLGTFSFQGLSSSICGDGGLWAGCGLRLCLLDNMVVVDLPLHRLCASIAPSADTVGSWHAEAELRRNHRAAIVTAAGVTSRDVHRIPEFRRNRAESVWHSEISGQSKHVHYRLQWCSSGHATLQPCECRKSETWLHRPAVRC